MIGWGVESVRREGNSRADTASALALGQRGRIRTSARSAAERVLLLIGGATMADTFLHAGSGTETSITREHAEALVIRLDILTGASYLFSTYLREGGHLCLSIVRRDVVDGDTLAT